MTSSRSRGLLLSSDAGEGSQREVVTIRHSMRLIEFPDTIDLAFDKTELRKDGRDEPVLPAAVVADFIEATRLDPTRVGLNPETNAPKPSVWRGPIGSLLLHLLPMLALI